MCALIASITLIVPTWFRCVSDTVILFGAYSLMIFIGHRAPWRGRSSTRNCAMQASSRLPRSPSRIILSSDRSSTMVRNLQHKQSSANSVNLVSSRPFQSGPTTLTPSASSTLAQAPSRLISPGRASARFRYLATSICIIAGTSLSRDPSSGHAE